MAPSNKSQHGCYSGKGNTVPTDIKILLDLDTTVLRRKKTTTKFNMHIYLNKMVQTRKSIYAEGKLLVIWGIKVVCGDDH